MRSGCVVDLQIQSGDGERAGERLAGLNVEVRVTRRPAAPLESGLPRLCRRHRFAGRITRRPILKGHNGATLPQKTGCFRCRSEMKFNCSCPDSARMCKHVAAVLYGIGARLDEKPELRGLEIGHSTAT